MAFYTSGYAVSPYESEGTSLSLQGLLSGGLSPSFAYLIRFQAARFDTDKVSLFPTALVISTLVVMAVNSWYVARHEKRLENVAMWVSLALFPLGGAVLTMAGRGLFLPVPPRYAPGTDGFWIGFVALALLASAYRQRRIVVTANAVLITIMVILTVQKDMWLLERNADPYPESCDQCVLEYPLSRGDCFRVCFLWGEEQSVYHLAALRLSVFRDERPRLVLREAKSPVVVDMPNRWLSVYVRDYMLAGVAPEDTYHIAPLQGTWKLPTEPYSPYYRGEWSTDILREPLTNTYATPDAFAAEFPARLIGQPRVWYINTPETEVNFERIERVFAEGGYVGQAVPISDPRYVAARFAVRCFEARGSGACSRRAIGTT
jgi:hypothetical protein